ncbi:hypothetical protein [Bradyrhizobium elkanii]|uniref:Uncharacterized protein n=1 Tax=Bradyrhizobium elkanii TaxID=29448 RepID=A0ABV4F6A1_BRAEL|nr:hypothetical protein [Bradyrhizobium elkanii]MBP2433637.1 hypothetical protein [Bradyrhizobium elkanii]MCP1750556.1 hypothetical protein [Bradyrhizobium elkanii]MCP1976330.1 hypothetical protein [Bradyrhizobium elkanii]MCS3889151.1 hypothetical protein [Bradyrhizobium elkanii]MCS4211827.1 hypothetical protein [Bradyrhizobium elkanii]
MPSTGDAGGGSASVSSDNPRRRNSRLSQRADVHRIDAEPGTPDFVRLYSEAIAAKPNKGAETFSSLIDYFKDQSEYKGLGDKSKRAYDQYLALIEAKFGAMPLGAIEDRRARGDFKAFRNTFASRPRKADYVWTTTARVLSVAKDHGKIAVNVCERGGRLYESDRSEIWAPTISVPFAVWRQSNCLPRSGERRLGTLAGPSCIAVNRPSNFCRCGRNRSGIVSEMLAKPIANLVTDCAGVVW